MFGSLPSALIRMPVIQEPSELAQIHFGEIVLSDDREHGTRHPPAIHGLIRSMPVCSKSLVLRVAHVASCARQIAAI